MLSRRGAPVLRCSRPGAMHRPSADRADAGGLAVARLPDSAAGAGQRPSLWHALHAAARSRRRRGCRRAVDAAGARAGAHALILRDMSLDGAAMKAFSDALRRDGLQPARAAIRPARLPRRHPRRRSNCCTTRSARRNSRNCAASAAASPNTAPLLSTWRGRADEVTAALEIFLKLEASGWKGQRGTALIQRDGDASFIRRAAPSRLPPPASARS